MTVSSTLFRNVLFILLSFDVLISAAKVHLFYFTALIQIPAFSTKIMVSAFMRIVNEEFYAILQQKSDGYGKRKLYSG